MRVEMKNKQIVIMAIREQGGGKPKPENLSKLKKVLGEK
jgi:hypothetical protein